jgi:hypothetical protein
MNRDAAALVASLCHGDAIIPVPASPLNSMIDSF